VAAWRHADRSAADLLDTIERLAISGASQHGPVNLDELQRID
jgi:hypothetical protein